MEKIISFCSALWRKEFIFMLLKVRNWTVISPAKNYWNYVKHAFITTKETALASFNLAHPVKSIEFPVKYTNRTATLLWCILGKSVVNGMLSTVTCHVNAVPSRHRINVNPSGRLASSWMKPLRAPWLQRCQRRITPLRVWRHFMTRNRERERERERERTSFATTLQKQTTIQTVNMWQAARKGLKPIELTTKKRKKN